MLFGRSHPSEPDPTGARLILLVDDDEEIRAALRGWLTEAGWTVLEASDGLEAWEAVQEHEPAVVISDLLMPRCHGFRLCKLIREHPTLNRTRFIISSSRGYPADRINAIDTGADEYLVKPVQRNELFRILDRVVAGQSVTAFVTKPPSPPPLAAGDPPEAPPVDPGKTSIRFWGVRGSLPVPGPKTVHYGGNTTCVELRAGNEIIILDAGTGIRGLGMSLMEEFKGRPVNATLLVSHTHWDHIQGFPYFIPAYDPRNRLRICGFQGYNDGIQRIFSMQMESPYFPVTLREMPSSIIFEELTDMEFNVGDVHVQAAFANHPGICVGYRLNTAAGSVAFFPDNEPHQRLRGQSTDEVTSESIAYARKLDERMIDFIRGVDVLIIDSQYDDTEYRKHIGWGHGCLDDVVTLALFAGVKKLFLFHHDPGHDDAQITKMVEWARDLVALHGDTLQVEAAREGVEVVLKAQPAEA